jgi:alpha-tubulin suppressor-like RCC1 family protein
MRRALVVLLCLGCLLCFFACGSAQKSAGGPAAAGSLDASAAAATAIDASAPNAPTFTDVQATYERTCAAGVDGYAYAWGAGIGESPMRVGGLRAVKRVGCVDQMICALDKYGAITCEGHRGYGARSSVDVEEQKITGLPPASDFVLTHEGGCAIASGDMWCWRSSRFSSDDFPVVEPIDNVHDVLRLRTDYEERTCAIRSSGPPVCVSRFPDPRPEKVARRDAGDAGPPPLARTIEEHPELEGARDVMPLARPSMLYSIAKDGAITSPLKLPATARATAFYQAGPGHVCVQLESGEAMCGPREPTNEFVFGVRVAVGTGLDDVASSVRAPSIVSINDDHACALGADGLFCWGHASEGQLGDGTPYDHSHAVKVPGVAHAAHLSVGPELTCVALADGKVSCWGAWSDERGAGPRNEDFAPKPLAVPVHADDVMSGPRLSDVLCVKSGDAFSCRIGDQWLPLDVGKKSVGDKLLRGSGIRYVNEGSLVTNDNHARIFGPDTGKITTQPNDLDKVGIRVTELSLDGYCAITTQGDIACGHCGACDVSEAKRSITRIHGKKKYVQVSSILWRWDNARPHVCGLTEDGAVECFHGDDIPYARSERVTPAYQKTFGALKEIVQISGNGGHQGRGLLCALDKSGAVFCAGDNSHGQRGIGTKETIPPGSGAAPEQLLSPVVGLPPAVEIGVTSDHACARTAAGDVYCWGDNERGGAPDGAPGIVEKPVRVVLAPEPR